MIATAKTQTKQFAVKSLNEIEFEVIDLERMRKNRVQHNLVEPVQCTCSRFKYLKQGERCQCMEAIIPYLPQYEVITDAPAIPYVEFDGQPVPQAGPQPMTKTMTVVESPPWARSPHREPLRGQQQAAFDQVHRWWVDGAQQPFLLQGYAGTGKSFSAQKIIHALKELHKERRDRDLHVALCAPTHKARAVLEQFAASAGLDVDIMTLHSLLHLKPGGYSKRGKQKMMVNELSSSPHYEDYDLVLVDESSMIGPELMSHIPGNVPTIFMGDRAQLPPVEGDEEDKEDAAREKLSPIFDLNSGIELTEVQRYEGEIAAYVTELRQDLLAKYPPKFVSGGNLSKLKQEEWNQTLIQTYLDGIHRHHGIETMQSTRALAWSNARVAQINQLVRDAICLDAGLDTSVAYHPGELVVAKEPIVKEVMGDRGYERRILMATCGEAFVTSTRPTTITMRHYATKERFSLPCVELELRTDLGQEYLVNTVPSQNEQAWAAVTEYFAEWRQACIAGKGLWREFYVALEDLNLVVKGSKLLPRLQYAYALTVHQSQGSTFKQVFVDSSNLYGCQHPWLRNRLFYTAYSRASQHLYSLSKF